MNVLYVIDTPSDLLRQYPWLLKKRKSSIEDIDL